MSAHKYLFLVARASECLFELRQKDSKIYLLEQRKAPNHSPDFIIITERCARCFFFAVVADVDHTAIPAMLIQI